MQAADVTGRPAGEARLPVHDIEGLRRGIVVKDGAAGGPGHQCRVGVTVQCGQKAAVGTWCCTGRVLEKNIDADIKKNRVNDRLEFQLSKNMGRLEDVVNMLVHHNYSILV